MNLIVHAKISNNDTKWDTTPYPGLKITPSNNTRATPREPAQFMITHLDNCTFVAPIPDSLHIPRIASISATYSSEHRRSTSSCSCVRPVRVIIRRPRRRRRCPSSSPFARAPRSPPPPTPQRNNISSNSRGCPRFAEMRGVRVDLLFFFIGVEGLRPPAYLQQHGFICQL